MTLPVDARRGDDIRVWARQRLRRDPHGAGECLGNMAPRACLDTDAHDVYRRRGSHGHSKYRIRHYENDDAAFLERKLRTGLRVTVRRTRIPLEAMPGLRLDDPNPTRPARWFAAQTLGLAGSGTAALRT